MSERINMHYARTVMNRDEAAREWVEQWLKERERERFAADAQTANLPDEEFERHWRYVRPERMHEGAIDGVRAYLARPVRTSDSQLATNE